MILLDFIDMTFVLIKIMTKIIIIHPRPSWTCGQWVTFGKLDGAILKISLNHIRIILETA